MQAPDKNRNYSQGQAQVQYYFKCLISIVTMCYALDMHLILNSVLIYSLNKLSLKSDVVGGDGN